MAYQQPPTEVKIVCGERVAPTVYEHYPRTSSRARGAVQIVCGSMLLILTGVVVFRGALGMANGFILPILAIIAGSFGIVAGNSKTACPIVTNLVLSIVCATSSCGVFVLAAIWLRAMDQLNELFPSSGYDSMRGPLVVLMIFAVAEALAAICSAAINCHFVCFCCKNCCCKYDLTITEKIMVCQSNEQQHLNQVVAGQNVVSGYQMPEKPGVRPPLYEYDQ